MYACVCVRACVCMVLSIIKSRPHAHIGRELAY